MPHVVLSRVQQNFHTVIRNEIRGIPNVDEQLYLPLLEPLTELLNEVVWFPIWCGIPKAGYCYRLDGRDLLVQSRNIVGTDEVYTYRITEEYVFDVGENAAVFADENGG